MSEEYKNFLIPRKEWKSLKGEDLHLCILGMFLLAAIFVTGVVAIVMSKVFVFVIGTVIFSVMGAVIGIEIIDYR